MKNKKIKLTFKSENDRFNNEMYFDTLKDAFNQVKDKLNYLEYLDSDILHTIRCNHIYYDYLHLNHNPEILSDSNDENIIKNNYKNIIFKSYDEVSSRVQYKEIVEGIYFIEDEWYYIDIELEISIEDFLSGKIYEQYTYFYNEEHTEQYETLITLQYIK
jgi:hypothetical protein